MAFYRGMMLALLALQKRCNLVALTPPREALQRTAGGAGPGWCCFITSWVCVSSLEKGLKLWEWERRSLSLLGMGVRVGTRGKVC